LDVYEVEAVAAVDLLQPMRGDPDARTAVRVWARTVSDMDLHGCISLGNPQPPQPSGELMDKSFPVLGLIDSLVAQDYMGIDKNITHSKTSGKFWDSTCAHIRSYLQCILCFPY
jgi:hypothetical protein